MKRERVDRLLVERGLAPTRTRAQALVMAGRVLVGERRVEKASESFPPDAPLRVRGDEDPASRYVGRGGLKLEKALLEFRIDPRGFVCLDVGASTGGFTDCLLQHGASRVVALDVGHNQIDWSLRTDVRVEVREGVNARNLRAEDFRERFDMVTMDVSFISATKILPALVPLLKEGGRVVVLVKPQFEVGRGEVGKGGVVRDPAQHARVVEEVNTAARSLGLAVRGVTDSPITGADGNREFLALYEQTRTTRSDSPL
ncbi:MAG: rRNA (cytidine1920-2-O)/16S rRNA (cytidine1409-2-O)-methyltransferase [Acidobacteriota bacterium]|nr:rRNA (cytidine1920-2-O)/16S rRNA (cytidine1409-2-O)-methyltransferase [Acidobacteriota bacterium]MDT5262817.1 rRNA (cytidine1920-2-O)/16S rRNA (cytidine1409-2-O)-methyltransferase [Acidobacteriota bacterium]MDT7780128.1 rRNA (cytidine1920-2-O)/16S rRNA (cytidine1409-2-O)-methyltransferase [Acidobacteriota bacterium]